MFTKKSERVLFAAIMALFMSGMVSLVTTLKNLGFVDGVASKWVTAWSIAFPVAFAVAFALAPVVRSFSKNLTKQ